MIPSVLLLTPPVHSIRFKKWIKEYLGINYIAASLRKASISTKIIPLHIPNYISHNQLISVFKQNSPIMGITISQATLGPSLTLMSLIRQNAPKTKIVIGGHFPTIVSEKILNTYFHDADYIIQGEGEHEMIKLTAALLNNKSIEDLNTITKRINGKWKKSSANAVVANINTIPFASRDYTSLIKKFNPQLAVLGSRGCLGNCKFCSVCRFYSHNQRVGWRGRNPLDIVEEMYMLATNFKIESIEFRDDCFIGDRGDKAKSRIYAFCDLKDKKIPDLKFSAFIDYKSITTDIIMRLAKSRMYSCLIGVESISTEMSKRYGKYHNKSHLIKMLKLLDENGILVRPTMLPNSPYSTLNTLKEDFNFIKKHCVPLNYFPMFEYYSPFEGTPLCDELKKDGLLVVSDITKKPHGYHFQNSQAACFAQLGIIATRFIVRPCADQLYKDPNLDDKEQCYKFMKILVTITDIFFKICGGKLNAKESIKELMIELTSLELLFSGYNKGKAIKEIEQLFRRKQMYD